MRLELVKPTRCRRIQVGGVSHGCGRFRPHGSQQKTHHFGSQWHAPCHWYTFGSLPPQSLRYFFGDPPISVNTSGAIWVGGFCRKVTFKKIRRAKFGRTQKGKVSSVRWNSWMDWSPLDGWLKSQPGWAQNAPVRAWVFPYQLIDILDILDSALDLDLLEATKISDSLSFTETFFLFDTSTVDGHPVHVFFGGHGLSRHIWKDDFQRRWR